MVNRPPPHTRARTISGLFSFACSPKEVGQSAAGGDRPQRPVL